MTIQHPLADGLNVVVKAAISASYSRSLFSECITQCFIFANVVKRIVDCLVLEKLQANDLYSHWCRNFTVSEPSLSFDPSGIASRNLFKQMQISLKTFTRVSSLIPFSCQILMLNRYDATGFQQKPNTINTLLKASQRQQQSRQGIVMCYMYQYFR